jgi:hypothetical protein
MLRSVPFSVLFVKNTDPAPVVAESDAKGGAQRLGENVVVVRACSLRWRLFLLSDMIRPLGKVALYQEFSIS